MFQLTPSHLSTWLGTRVPLAPRLEHLVKIVSKTCFLVYKEPLIQSFWSSWVSQSSIVIIGVILYQWYPRNSTQWILVNMFMVIWTPERVDVVQAVPPISQNQWTTQFFVDTTCRYICTYMLVLRSNTYSVHDFFLWFVSSCSELIFILSAISRLIFQSNNIIQKNDNYYCTKHLSPSWYYEGLKINLGWEDGRYTNCSLQTENRLSRVSYHYQVH